MFDLIVSQGRVADRTERTLIGAGLVGKVIERVYGIRGHWIGVPLPPANDDWLDSLAEAHDTLVDVRSAVEESILSGRLLVFVANTCPASLASLPVVARLLPEVVVLWIDAHGDFNTPASTTTGYLGGMVLAAACGVWDSGHGAGLSPERVVLIGTHDIDPEERKLLRKAGVRIIPPRYATPEAVLDAIGSSRVWIHIDWDVLEPGFVQADYEVTGGLLPPQLHAILAELAPDRIAGLEIAEFQAPFDEDSRKTQISIISGILSAVLSVS